MFLSLFACGGVRGGGRGRMQYSFAWAVAGQWEGKGREGGDRVPGSYVRDLACHLLALN